MGAAHAGRIVEPGLVEAALLEVADALGGIVLHVLLGAELDGARRTGLGAGRRLAHRHPVGAQRALVGLAVLLGDARDVEGAAGDAVAAADAVLLVEVDDAVGVLDDGARGRAGLEAARVAAVHAAVLADQPLQPALLFHFGEAHHGPRLGRQVDGVVVHPVVDADLVADVVPLHAGRLAGLAADAGGYVDQLRHLRGLAHRGCRSGGRRALLDV